MLANILENLLTPKEFSAIKVRNVRSKMYIKNWRRILKILVTGTAGFIGQRLASYFASQGHCIIATGRTKSAPLEIQGTYLPADLTRFDQCRLICEGIDAVVHCAGKAGAWGSYESYELANIVATKNLVQASTEAKVKRFINISSPSVYFDYKHQLMLKESNIPLKFSNAYAETKFLAESIVSASHSDAFWTLSFRPRGVIGAGDRNWLPRIIEMRKKNSLIQVGDGQNIVDFTSVMNLVYAVDLALQSGRESYGRVYNITNDSPERLWDVIEIALIAVGLDGQRKRMPLTLAMSLAKLSEAYHRLLKTREEPSLLPIKVGVSAYSMTLDISDAKRLLNYSPKYSTRDAIDEFAAAWKQG